MASTYDDQFWMMTFHEDEDGGMKWYTFLGVRKPEGINDGLGK